MVTADSPSSPALDLLGVIAPLIDQGRSRLRREARLLAGASGPFAAEVVEALLFKSLPGQLLGLLGRALILELHIARMQGILQGTTPADRFRSFVAHLQQPDVARTFLTEYPVLARQLGRCVERWVACGQEFLAHLSADWPALKATFADGRDPGPLTDVEAGAGDRHRGGRCVFIVTFASGLRLVYKPRSLAVDAHFQEFLTWANERGVCPAFATLRLLDQGDHGWVEYVSQRDCTTRDEVQRFYERLGGYLALTHALVGSDLHFENLVAAGEHPVLVDLEVLFHPLPPGWTTRGPAEQALADSILGTGLLPRVEFTEGGADGADISGLGTGSGQLSPAAELCLEGLGTDEMRLVRRRVPLPVGRHRPALAGTEVDPLDYRDALAAGFTRTYQLLLENRTELLAPGGLLERCAGDPVRYVVRPTRTYAIVLQQMGHPDRLRDEREQERLFDRLHVGTAHHPALAGLLAHERNDLTDGDVPLFTTRPDSLDLWSSSGDQLVDFFEGTGLDRARRRLQEMGPADLQRQLATLHAALAILPGAAGTSARTAPQHHAVGPLGRDDLLAAARAVGERLEALSWRSGEQAGWLGLKPVNEGRWSIAPLGADLYDGLPGVALFLAHLGDLTSEPRFTCLARAALAGLRAQLGSAAIRSVGAFEGWGGGVYALTHLARLWNEPGLLIDATAAAGRLTPLIDQDEDLDVVGGAAGGLICLLGLYRCLPSASVLSAAVRCGDHLLGRAVPQAQGLGWVTRLAASAPLTGLAHGAAGIGWALAELAAVTGEERFREAAQSAIRYETSLFDWAYGNWPDLRLPSSAGGPRFEVAWCHGAPGIGLTRLQVRRHLPSPQHDADIKAAAETTCAYGLDFSHTLCHGGLGNAEYVLEAARALDEPTWEHAARFYVARTVTSIRAGHWTGATPGGSETPGLMTGLAGIGYALLRFAEPDRVPSVLSLALPGK